MYCVKFFAESESGKIFFIGLILALALVSEVSDSEVFQLNFEKIFQISPLKFLETWNFFQISDPRVRKVCWLSRAHDELGMYAVKNKYFYF